MNRFFDGEFFQFGINVIRFMESDEEDRTDPMIFIFPRMTKCTFYKFGVSGEIERHDAVCILPLNVVNEKIYVFLWFWFLGLGALTLGVVLYRYFSFFPFLAQPKFSELRFGDNFVVQHFALLRYFIPTYTIYFIPILSRILTSM